MMSNLSAGRHAAASTSPVEALESRTFLSAGGPDPTFGKGGVASFAAPEFGDLRQVAEAPGGKLIAAGTSLVASGALKDELLLVRFNPNGSLDTSFDDDGWDTLTIPDNFGTVAAMETLPDGKTLVLGNRVQLLRLTPDLTPDMTFGQGGFVTIALPFTGSAGGRDIALQQGGKILVGMDLNLRTGSPDQRAGVARYNVDGSLDTTFSRDGVASVDMVPGRGSDGAEGLNAVTVLSDGRIVLGSTTILSTVGRGWAFASLGADGEPGPGDFLVRLQPPTAGGPSSVGDIRATSDGGFLVAGTARPVRWERSDIVLARFRGDGTPELTFGTDGYALAGFDPLTFAEGKWLGIQPDGHVIVGGLARMSRDSYPARYAAARFRPDGALDATFGAGGRATFATNPSTYPTDMIRTAAGDLVFSGIGLPSALVRLKTTGRPLFRSTPRTQFAPAPRDPFPVGVRATEVITAANLGSPSRLVAGRRSPFAG